MFWSQQFCRCWCRFRSLSQHPIEFNQVAIETADGQRDMINRVMTKDNVGLAVMLETTDAVWNKGQGSCNSPPPLSDPSPSPPWRQLTLSETRVRDLLSLPLPSLPLSFSPWRPPMQSGTRVRDLVTHPPIYLLFSLRLGSRLLNPDSVFPHPKVNN